MTSFVSIIWPFKCRSLEEDSPMSICLPTVQWIAHTPPSWKIPPKVEGMIYETIPNLAALGAWLVPALVLCHQSLYRLAHGDAGIFFDDAALPALDGPALLLRRLDAFCRRTAAAALVTVSTHHLAGRAGAAGLHYRGLAISAAGTAARRGERGLVAFHVMGDRGFVAFHVIAISAAGTAARRGERGLVAFHVIAISAAGSTARRGYRRAVAVNVISPSTTTEASGGTGTELRIGRVARDTKS